MASALILTACVTALHIQEACCPRPCFQAKCPVEVWPGLTLSQPGQLFPGPNYGRKGQLWLWGAPSGRAAPAFI